MTSLAAYRQKLEHAFPGRLRKFVLFGSVARGDAREDSDVDILVVMTSLTYKERGQAIDLGAEVGLASDLVFAPLVLTDQEWNDLILHERLLPQEIAKDGIAM